MAGRVIRASNPHEEQLEGVRQWLRRPIAIERAARVKAARLDDLRQNGQLSAMRSDTPVMGGQIQHDAHLAALADMSRDIDTMLHEAKRIRAQITEQLDRMAFSGELKPAEVRAVTGAYLYGMSRQKLAEIEGVDVRTIARHIARALDALAPVLS